MELNIILMGIYMSCFIYLIYEYDAIIVPLVSLHVVAHYTRLRFRAQSMCCSSRMWQLSASAQ